MTKDFETLEEQEIRAQAEQVRGRLEGLTAELGFVDEEVGKLAPQRAHHELLEQACGSLEKLDELGAASLFWGESAESERVSEQLRTVRSRVSAFQAQLGRLEERRQAILVRIGGEEEGLEFLADDLYQFREAEERRKLEWVVEREISPMPQRLQFMAWARGGEDDRRFRRSLAACLLASLLLGVLVPMIDLPLPSRLQADEVLSRRLVEFIRQEQARPLPPSTVLGGTPEQDLPDPQEPEPVEADEPPERPPLEAETQTAALSEPSGPPGPIGPEPPVGAPP
jgi:hypothetical protein